MSRPKEPNFFSNDESWMNGVQWYRSLFKDARTGDICGESSTHYTKLPDFPNTINRMLAVVPDVKLIYVMRHPIDRLISQYIHEWSERTIDFPIDRAIREVPRFSQYSLYARQLQPYLQAFGASRVLPVFFERFISHTEEEFRRIARFIGYTSEISPVSAGIRHNASDQRLRRSRARELLVDNTAATWLRRRFIPRSWRDRIKGHWQMRTRPRLTDESREYLHALFDRDLNQLGNWLGVELDTRSYMDVVKGQPLEWRRPHQCLESAKDCREK